MTRLKHLALVVVLLAPFASSAVADDVTDAHAAALTWLGTIDAGTYATAYQNSSPTLRSLVTESDWVEGMNDFRQPLGSMLSRTLSVGTAQSSLEGMPDGNYVVLEFTTAFANKASAKETVVMKKTGFTTWKALSYFIS